MAYCTIDDVTQAVPPATLKALTQDDPAAQSFNVVIVNAAIADASELVDAALRGRYPLPLASVPSLIKSLTVDIVRHQLYMRRPDGGELPDGVVRSFKTANQNLQAIATGILSLGIKTTGSAMPENGPWRMKAPKRRFEV